MILQIPSHEELKFFSTAKNDMLIWRVDFMALTSSYRGLFILLLILECVLVVAAKFSFLLSRLRI